MATETQTDRKPYQETPHKRKIRELAGSLQSQISLPPILHCIIVELKPRRFHPDRGSFLINVGEEREIGVELSIDNGEDIDQIALKSHLETGGFSDVLGELENWKQGVQQYFKKCHDFLVTVISEIENKKRKIPLEDKKLKLGFIIDFPRTICAHAIETASGYSLRFAYKVEPHPIDSNLWILRYGAYGIYLAKSKKTLEHYQKMHKKLITRYASEPIVRDIVEQQAELNGIRNNINQRLRVFREKEHLPGRCNELCS